jgi:hypothetical protein
MGARTHRLFRYLSPLALSICAVFPFSACAQDASGQIEQFLNAFRGKPVGPVASAPAQTPTPQNAPTPGNLASPVQTTPASPRQDSVANASACPPGVDRLGCPNSSQQRNPSSCPAGTTFGPSGCVPTAMPANAHRVSEDGQWQCDDGYLRYGAICIPLQSSSH